MNRFLVILLAFLFSGLSFGQEIIVVDAEKNPIANVSAFNSSKTKGVLSNKDGIVNLSRFLSSDTIFMQHPNYALKKLIKSDIVGFIELEEEYSLLQDVVISEEKNLNNIKNAAGKKIYITKAMITELNAQTTANLLEKRGGETKTRKKGNGKNKK